VRFESQTRIPFRVLGGQVVDFYTGQPLPLSDGTVGDVVIDSVVVPERVNKLLGREERRFIASSGSRVLICLSQATERQEELVPHPQQKPQTLLPKIMCAEGRLKGDLYLLLRGTKKAKLLDVPLCLDGFDEEFVSVNQAYTAASQRYETHRRSHSGNVFLCTFVDGITGLTLLEDIRRWEESAFEARTYVVVKGMNSAKDWLLTTLQDSAKTEEELLESLKSQILGTEPIYAKKILSTLLEEFGDCGMDGRWLARPSVGKVTG
jgi:hypothetical protein